MPLGARRNKRARLITQKPRPIEANANSAPANRGVFLWHWVNIGQDFIAAQIKRAKRHRIIPRYINRFAV